VKLIGDAEIVFGLDGRAGDEAGAGRRHVLLNAQALVELKVAIANQRVETERTGAFDDLESKVEMPFVEVTRADLRADSAVG
jgi:hypothetical protein